MSIAVRVGALVVAVGLVLGALVLRAGRDGTREVVEGPTTGQEVIDAVTATLVCTDDLEALCRDALPIGSALPVEGRPADALASDLARAGTTTSALVPTAWADVVDDARARAGLPPLERGGVVVSTTLAMAVWEDRGAVLAAACGLPDADALTWSCVGDHADRPWQDLGGDVRWGRVVVGHASPDQGLGLVATTAVVASRTGQPFALAQLRDPAFTAWFRQLERAIGSFDPAGGSHLRAMVTRGPSVADVAVATIADAATLPVADTAFGAITVVQAAPVLPVDLVVVGSDPDAVVALTDALRTREVARAFADRGWNPGPAVPPDDTTELSPLPDGGVLTAVRTVWDEVAG